MTKIAPNILGNIPIIDLKKVLSEKGNLPGVKKHIRGLITNLLDENGSNIIELNDFKKIKQNLIYINILEKYRKDLPYSLINKISVLYTSPDELESSLSNENIQNIIKFSKEKNLELVISLCKNSKDFEYLCNNKNIGYVLQLSNEENFISLFSLCNNKSDLEIICNNENIKYILQSSDEDKFKWLMTLCENIKDFVEICNIPKIIYILETHSYDLSIISNLSKKEIKDYLFSDNYHSFKILCISPQYLFNIKSTGNSKFYESLISEMKENEQVELAKILNKLVEKEFNDLTHSIEICNESERINNGIRINDYQEKKMTDENKEIITNLGLDKNKHELSIYLRYGHTVDYPEIAEAIILFAQKYVNAGFSRYFSNIRIVPRYKHKLPNKSIIEEKTSFYTVSGKSFISALHSYSSGVFLSHSSESKPYKTPNIISNSMISNPSSIKSKIELEKSLSRQNFEKGSNLNEILHEFLKNLIQLEKELDKIN